MRTESKRDDCGNRDRTLVEKRPGGKQQRRVQRKIKKITKNRSQEEQEDREDEDVGLAAAAGGRGER